MTFSLNIERRQFPEPEEREAIHTLIDHILNTMDKEYTGHWEINPNGSVEKIG